MSPYEPNPERDRRVASAPRSPHARQAQLAEILRAWTRSPEVQAMRRFAKVRSALDTALGERARHVTPVQLRQGILTLEVADGVLLAELRQLRARALLDALAKAGTGATRVVWRVARQSGR